MNSKQIKIISENRKARFNYQIEDEFEAGMVLTGTEVKSLRQGRANLKDAFARIRGGEIFLYQLHISPYSFAYYDNHEPLRPRKLLLHRHQIKQIAAKINEKGYSFIPLRLYFKDGKVKAGMALARGKKTIDKRETIRQREERRDMDRARKENR